MKLLMIGGTGFSGYFATEYALARGHDVTLFTRGKSNADAFPGAEKIQGDRGNFPDLEALRGRKWDVVIDMVGYVPRVVQASLDLLGDAVERYLFVSSVSVYSAFPPEGVDESGPVETLSDPTIEQVTGETYGKLKVMCEQAVRAALSERALIIRPGLVVGPRDHTDRFNHWPRRASQGGEMLAPGTPADPVQFIDARDLGEFFIRAAEARLTGVYNALGPDKPLNIGTLLEACLAETGHKARLTWVDEKFLEEHNVQPWSELPVWVPSSDVGLHRTNNARAIAVGLTFRPIQDTVRATLDSG